MTDPIKPKRGAIFCPIPRSKFHGPERAVEMRTMRFMRNRLVSGRSSRQSGLLLHKCTCCARDYPADTRFFNVRPEDAIGLNSRCRVCSAHSDKRRASFITRESLDALASEVTKRPVAANHTRIPAIRGMPLVMDECLPYAALPASAAATASQQRKPLN